MAFDFNTATPDDIRLEAERRQAKRDKRELVLATDEEAKLDRLEKEEQKKVIELYVRYSCRVFNNSQPRKAKYITPGCADLLVFSPHLPWLPNAAAFKTVPNRVMWYHETKRPRGGRYSDDQLKFAALCREAGITVLGGGVSVAQAHLDRLGIEPT